jgi:NTE family protein
MTPVPAGGVLNNTPILHAVELGSERIDVLPTQGSGGPRGRVPSGALDTPIHALGVLVDGSLDADLARYSSEAELIVLPAPNAQLVQPTDFEHSSRLIGLARDACRGLLGQGDAVDARRSTQLVGVARRTGARGPEARARVNGRGW